MNLFESKFITIKILLALVISVSACSEGLDRSPVQNNDPIVLTPIQLQEIETQSIKSFKLYFQNSDFYNLTNPNRFSCAGDARVFRNPYKFAATGLEEPFEDSLRINTETIKPAFIKNVSVDLTNTHQRDNNNEYVYPAGQCSISGANTPPVRACATFSIDENNPLPGQSVQSQSSQYYTLEHYNCSGVGPVQTRSFEFAGGIDIDLNSDFIGDNEEIMIKLKYFPIGRNNTRVPLPNGDPQAPSQRAEIESLVANVHLIYANEEEASIQNTLQPRYFRWFENSASPTVSEKLFSISAPRGQPVEKVFTISSAQYRNFDRIRIERVSGSAIFISLAMYLMGPR